MVSWYKLLVLTTTRFNPLASSMILPLFALILCSFACTLSVANNKLQRRFIYGGSYVNITDYPFFVLVIPIYWKILVHNICGGSIIAKHWVLTAAHCFREVEAVKLKMGMTTLTDEAVVMDARFVLIDHIYTIRYYKNFNDALPSYDIALVYTYEEIPCTSRIKPIKLAMEYDDRVMDVMTVIGFGNVGYGKNKTRSLRLKGLNVTSISPMLDCLPENKRKWVKYEPNRPAKLICAGDASGGNSTPLHGDSGAPLVGYSGVRNEIVQYGILSQRAPEARAIYVKVSTRLDSIYLWMRRYSWALEAKEFDLQEVIAV